MLPFEKESCCLFNLKVLSNETRSARDQLVSLFFFFFLELMARYSQKKANGLIIEVDVFQGRCGFLDLKTLGSSNSVKLIYLLLL